MCSENIGRVVGFARRQFQHLPDDVFDGLREGRQDVDEAAHQWRHDERHTVGIGERVGLRQHRGEDHDQQGDRSRSIGDADLAVEIDCQVRGKRGGEHVDECIAEQHGADHLLWPRQNLIDELSGDIAVFFQGVHASTRRSRQRGFAGVEECRQQDQQENRDETYEYGHLKLPASFNQNGSRRQSSTGAATSLSGRSRGQEMP